MNKKLKIVLLVSLAVNLIMFGFLIGNAGKRHLHPENAYEKPIRDHESRDKGPLRRVISHLPDEQKATAKQEMKQLRKQNKETHEALRELRRELKSAVDTEPFDQEKFVESTKQIRQLKNRIERRHTQFIAKVLAQLPPEKRAKAMRQFFKRHHPRRPD